MIISNNIFIKKHFFGLQKGKNSLKLKYQIVRQYLKLIRKKIYLENIHIGPKLKHQMVRKCPFKSRKIYFEYMKLKEWYKKFFLISKKFQKQPQFHAFFLDIVSLFEFWLRCLNNPLLLIDLYVRPGHLNDFTLVVLFLLI